MTGAKAEARARLHDSGLYPKQLKTAPILVNCPHSPRSQSGIFRGRVRAWEKQVTSRALFFGGLYAFSEFVGDNLPVCRSLKEEGF